MSSTKYGLDVYKNYEGSVLSLEGDDGEGISWRNISGEMVIDVSCLFPYVFDDIVESATDATSVLSTLCYQRPYAGAYEITVDNESYTAYHDIYNTYYSALLISPLGFVDESALSESALWREYQQQAVLSAQECSPIKVNLDSYSKYDIFGPAIDRLAIAIDILDGVFNDQVIPGFGMKFNADMSSTDKTQLMVGGSYIAPEDRHCKGTIFGTLPIHATSENSQITVKNISGKSLTSLTAKVVNRYAVKQSSHNRPFSYIDQAGIVNATIVSPFQEAVVQFSDTLSCLTKMTIDSEYYDVRTYPDSVLIEGDDIEIGSPLLTCDSQTKYMFDSGTPLAGLLFALNKDLESGDYATVYTYDGEDVYELSLDGNTWYTTEIAIANTLSDQETTTLYIRANPKSTLVSNDTYGSDAYLRIMGAYTEVGDPVSLGTWTNMGWAWGGYPSHKGIRLILPPIPYKADGIRVKFGTGNTYSPHLKINQAYFGARDGTTKNFRTSPPKGQFLFNGETSLDLINEPLGDTTIEQWTDWLNFTIGGNTEHIIAYDGPVVGNPTYEAGEAYYKDQGDDSDYDIVVGYTADASGRDDGGHADGTSRWYDVREVQIRVQDYVLSLIPLTTTVPENVSGATIDAWILNNDLSSALEECGITMEVV